MWKKQIWKRQIPLWAMVVALISVSGLVVASVLVHRTLTGTVTIDVYGDVGLLNGDTGILEELTSLDFGPVNPEEKASKTVVVENRGNTDLWLTVIITTPEEIKCTTEYIDGTWFKPTEPKLLRKGEQLSVVIIIWSTPSAYGTFDIMIDFIGSTT